MSLPLSDFHRGLQGRASQDRSKLPGRLQVRLGRSDLAPGIPGEKPVSGGPPDGPVVTTVDPSVVTIGGRSLVIKNRGQALKYKFSVSDPHGPVGFQIHNSRPDPILCGLLRRIRTTSGNDPEQPFVAVGALLSKRYV